MRWLHTQRISDRSLRTDRMDTGLISLFTFHKNCVHISSRTPAQSSRLNRTKTN